MLKLALPMILAVAAGISLVVQQALNANLRAALNSAAWSGFMSYFVGVICMAAFALLLRDPIPSAATAARIPWFEWSGGCSRDLIGLAISSFLNSAPRRFSCSCHRPDARIDRLRPFWSGWASRFIPSALSGSPAPCCSSAASC